MSGEPRWWLLDALKGEDTSQSNRINEVNDVMKDTGSEMAIVGLVDEKAGGVIGYLSATHATLICERLNKSEEK